MILPSQDPRWRHDPSTSKALVMRSPAHNSTSKLSLHHTALPMLFVSVVPTTSSSRALSSSSSRTRRLPRSSLTLKTSLSGRVSTCLRSSPRQNTWKARDKILRMARWNQKRHGSMVREGVDEVPEVFEEAIAVVVAETIVTEVTETEVTATQMTGREDVRRTEHQGSRMIVAEGIAEVTREEAAAMIVGLKTETASVRSERMG